MRSLVLLHGFTGTPRSWDELCAHLADVPTLRPALFGHEGGDARVGSFEEEVDRLALLVRQAALEGAHLVGYSLGGRIALGLLVRHPQLFASATLIGAHPGLSDPAEREARVRSDEALAATLDRDGLEPFLATWESLPLFETQRALSTARLERQRADRRSHDPRGLSASLRVLGLGAMPDYRPVLPAITVPVTLAVGALDPKFRDLAGEMEKALPNARRCVFEGAGHNLVLERPEALAAVILSAWREEEER